MMGSSSSLHQLLLTLFFTFKAFPGAHGNLSTNYYSRKYPQALSIVKTGVVEVIKNETRIGASLLRLHFHDYFVNSCDASILLDDTVDFVGKIAAPNNNSVRGFDVVDHIKAVLENACPGVVSCVDILALAARDFVVYLGGPSWKVRLGRRDSTTASGSIANTFIPSPASNISSLISSFSAQGLSLKDLVAHSGSHTIGLARCTTYRVRNYSDKNTIDTSFVTSLQRKCPRSGNDDNLAPLDLKTPNCFDNLYFKNLLKKRGLLHSDQVLFTGSSADTLVRRYASNNMAFFKNFANAMVKMGNIHPLTGRRGEIRTDCRKVN